MATKKFCDICDSEIKIDTKPFSLRITTQENCKTSTEVQVDDVCTSCITAIRQLIIDRRALPKAVCSCGGNCK